MSEPVSNDVSTESLCTVIDAKIINNNNYKDFKENGYHSEETSTSLNDTNSTINDLDESPTRVNGNLSSSAFEDTECETDPEKSIIQSQKPKGKLKKSVSFDPNDEKIKKFIEGEPIIDQQNPFKSNSLGKNQKKKVPPPVPAKRSTLSIRKTVTQQLREREREKEKERERERERERLKNETNLRKNFATTTGTNGHLANGSLNSSDDFITTEEVLKQSKYVKTYIKNPDPYFVYDPTILAKIKFEELKELTDKKIQAYKKVKSKETPKPASRKAANGDLKPKVATFKKCSKPNYPELSDIKIKVGTESDGSFFNPAEVTKNARKFDERVKKLHLNSEDDIDEIDGPLTKSESSDEVTSNTLNSPLSEEISEQAFEEAVEKFSASQSEPIKEEGTFTNTIKSKEFQEYLEKKGLTLIPKKIPSGAQNIYQPNPSNQPNKSLVTLKPAGREEKISTMPIPRAESPPRKLSVFQRLLANSIFASRRRTTPKDTVPMPRSVQQQAQNDQQSPVKVNPRTPLPIKRVVLERQSFHGRPKASNNLLSSSESTALRRQNERTRKSFASGDDLSLSISSALTNADHNEELENQPYNQDQPQLKAIAKPPRRSLSRDRLHKANEALRKQNGFIPIQGKDGDNSEVKAPQFRRSLERQSFIPKRSMPEVERKQIFNRSSSMDRNEILKRSTQKGLQIRAQSVDNDKSVEELPKLSPELKTNGPIMTSTPIREASASNAESKSFAPVQVLPTAVPGNIRINQEEWAKIKALKEKTDQELFNQVQKLTSQQHLDNENIYEHLRSQQEQASQQTPQPQTQTLLQQQNFLRGSPQRNTFSGVIRNRQVKIIDGKPLIFNEKMPQQSLSNSPSSGSTSGTVRSQSVLDNMITPQESAPRQNLNSRRGYESENETPVVFRRKPAEADKPSEPRRIGGLLTREEILQKVKEFCRKSLNKTPSNNITNQHTPMQAIYEQRATNSTDLSPVSYASVETHNRSVSRIFNGQQGPQRLQTLPQQFVPIKQELVAVEPNIVNPSPIYAHVIKRSSLQSQPSNDLYDSPQRPMLVRRSSDAKTVYLTQTPTIQLQTEQTYSSLPPTQYVIIEGDKITPAQIVSYQPATDIYTQPQYIRPSQLQPIPSPYGYITVREPLAQVQTAKQQPQFLRQRIHDGGRSTPLILDRSSQQASQIYWTPQHQRLQQHSGLVPVQISPRYVIKQPVYQMPNQRTSTLMSNATTATATTTSSSSTQPNYKPITKEQLFKELEHQKLQQQLQQQQLQLHQQQQQQQQQFSPIVRIQTPTQQLLSRQTLQRMQKYQPDEEQVQQIQRQPIEVSDWESGSEAGEVRRILENQSKHDFKPSIQQQLVQ